MPTPLPWSPSALSDYKNCPFAYYRKRVVKDVKDEGGEALQWGNKVHKAFELYIKEGKPLPDVLKEHQKLLDVLAQSGTKRWTERKIALGKDLKPCAFFADNVFYRAVIDFTSIEGCQAMIVDYKTGKKKADFTQLKLNAIWIFAEYPHVTGVEVRYYWTKEKTFSRELYTRHQIPELWGAVTPDLKNYKRSFHDDLWPTKPSGLCSWCPVRDCKHWKPRPPGR
jgi:hypothetical protein